MSTRREIAQRLGIFAKVEFNCGIGAGGFQPGNTCGGEGGSGSASSAGSKPAPSGKKPPSAAVKAIEDRARASGRSFTEQWMHEQRTAIAKGHEQDERRRQRSAERAAGKVREIEAKLAELKARGPERDPRAAAVDARIAAIDARLAEVTKARDEARAKREAAAAGLAQSKARMDDLRRQLAESKARSRGLRI